MAAEWLTWERVLLVVGVLAGLSVTSWWFNQWVDTLAETDPLGGYAAVLVVLGVAYTLVGALVALAVLLGVAAAFVAVGTVLVCFAASGLPMIVGDMRRAGRRRAEMAPEAGAPPRRRTQGREE